MVISKQKIAALTASLLVVGAIAGCSHSSPPPAPTTPTTGASAQPTASDIQKHMMLKSQQMQQARGMMQKH